MRTSQTIELTVVVLLAILCGSRSDCSAQTYRDPHAILAMVDSNTRWAFRSLSPVTVASPIVRLRDVVKPVDPQMAGWQRLSRSPIGLVPLSGQPMTIDRVRLSEAIRNAEATPSTIDWVGPEQIRVLYDPTSAPSQSVIQAGQTIVQELQGTGRAAPAGHTGVPTTASVPSLLPSQAKPIVAWIETALKQQHSEAMELYEIEIDLRQAALGPLSRMVGIPLVEFVSELQEGQASLRVDGRSVDGPCQSVIAVSLAAHPQVVFPRSSFPRGHRLRSGDLLIKPLPSAKVQPSYVSDPAELVGLEVRGFVRSNRPISRSDVGAPILITRGDLVDIQVIGGGVKVTTRAKAMEEGAEFDTIEVETLNPKKRLLARVVRSGLVEIVTRAPQLEP